MKKVILAILIVFGLISTSFSYGVATQVSSGSFPPPVLQLAP
ncbi:hypothetical protein CDV26_11245 [Francisella halioticida]|uniref:Uncharacterized protein n=1 Tax=Francisella halioticida TaxID=549298 RepID=A0ABN5B2Y2_9GAMM|nr:hypothetical protein [Francisella halioticida]ASG68872.1 hypothetical protein CDV26_11245 [Francisella halioticida]